MKKTFASAVFLIAFFIYALDLNKGAIPLLTNDATTTAPASDPSGTIASTQTFSDTDDSDPTDADDPQPTPAPTPAKTTPTPTPSKTPVTKPKGQYSDGTYIGSAADAYYGIVQVEVTVSGGRIANVSFLRYPNDRSTSQYINSQAMPLLKSEAIQAQNASVDGVSGATDTSMAFRQSLSAALSQARA